VHASKDGFLSAASRSAAITFVMLISAYFFFDGAFLRFEPGYDWAPLWAAGRLAWTEPSRIYDFAYVTQETPLVHPGDLRPFIYPPTALLLFSPLALLPFRLSLAIFVATSAALLARASSNLGAKPLLLVFAPPVVLAAITGQPTLLVSALIVYALLLLPRSKSKAGVLLGIAAALKPPLLILAPLALTAGRHWRSMLAAGGTLLALGFVSVLNLGFDVWQSWLGSLPKFQALITGHEPLLRNTVTPNGTAVRLGIDPLVPSLLGLGVAGTVVTLAFIRTTDPATRLIALIGGALLVTPYGMNYELAALGPAVATIAIRRVRDGIIPALWAFSMFVHVSVVGLAAVYCWGAFKLVHVPSVNDRLMQSGVDVPA
jgi:hypothetical protein